MRAFSMKQVAYIVGLTTFICTALIGQAELLGEPWRHYVTIAAIIGTAINAYFMQHPWDGVTERRAPREGDPPPVE